MKRKMICLTALLAILVLLPACGGKGRIKEARGLAESYLNELKSRVGEDSLSLKDDAPGEFGELLKFAAYSEKYGGDFSIYVNGNNTVTDTYYCVSLRDKTREDFSRLIKETLPDESPEWELSLSSSVMASSLSGRVFESVQQAHEAADNLFGLVQLKLAAGISEDGLSKLLQAMQSAELYGDVMIDEDVRVFHIQPEEINYTRTDNPPGEVKIYPYQ